MRLRRTHDSDPTLAVAGLYLLLTWNWLTGFLRLTTNQQKVTKLNNFFVGACVSGGAYALYGMLVPRVASISQTVSVESLLILSTLILANNAVFATPRKTSKPLYALRIVSFASLFLVCFSIVMGSSLWVGYMSCKEIEMSMEDANHILGATDILVFRIALLKTFFGALGFATWLYVAFLTYQRTQQSPHGSFPRIWLVASIGFFATFFEWRFLLRDFPQLWEAVGATVQQHTNINVACFAILSAIAFAQYCAADRGKPYHKTDAQHSGEIASWD